MLQTILTQLAQRWGKPEFHGELLHNLEFCDELLQALQHQPLDDAQRRDLYGNYIGPGPGGLAAFFWLARNDHLDPPLVDDYLACLQSGPARPEALSEAFFKPHLEWLLETQRPSLLNLCRLLNSDALSARARCAGLRQAVAFTANTRLAHWACRSNLNDVELPEANPELHKAGFLECVRLGESPVQVLHQALSQLPLAGAGQAVLELVETYLREIPAPLVKQALLALRDSGQPTLRRRAFPLLERNFGAEWIHQGLRDRDALVRSWALQRRNQTA